MLRHTQTYLKASRPFSLLGARMLAVMVTALALGATQAVHAEDVGATVTLPTVPINFSDLVTQATGSVGTLLAAVSGLIIIIALTIAGIKWVRNAVAGRAPR